MALTPPSQVLERQIDALEDENILILNHEHDTFIHDATRVAGACTALALDYQHYQAAQHASLKHEFGIMLQSHTAQQFDRVVIYYPKAKELAQYLMHLAAYYLKAEGTLWVVGENKSGIKTFAKQLPSHFSDCQKIDSARHCLLFEAQLDTPLTEFSLDTWQKNWQVETPQGTIDICSLPGVFSQKKLDKGTQLLLEHLPAIKGHTLDFGCGYGIISCALLKAQSKCKLDCVDINAMALKACELTLAANDLKASVYPSNGLNDVQQHYDAIVTNPPFHDGLKSTLSITKQFIQSCKSHLKPHGTLHLVANRHLPYADCLSETFGQAEMIAQTTQFSVFQQKK